MNDRKRLRRSDPARVAPVRNFSKLYSRPDSVNGSGPSKSHDAAQGSPPAEGVELAYSVIEKHIAEGRRAAEGFSNHPYTSRTPSDSLKVLVERILGVQAEILPLWIETLATLVKVNPARNGHAPGSYASSNSGQQADTSAVSIEVVSLRPVQVSVELRPNFEPQSLVSLGLSAVDSDKPVLKDISLVPDEAAGRVKLRLRIPESQPPGTYSGVIVNRQTGETRGTLTIRIAD